MPDLKTLIGKVLGVPVSKRRDTPRQSLQRLVATQQFKQGQRGTTIGHTSLRRGQRVQIKRRGTVLTLQVTEPYDTGWAGTVLTPGPQHGQTLWFTPKQLVKTSGRGT